MDIAYSDVNKDLGLKANAKDLDFGLNDQGQGLTLLWTYDPEHE